MRRPPVVLARSTRGSDWVSLIVAALLVPELVALVVRWILVPLGLYRAAYYAGSVVSFTTQKDGGSAGVWSAARALAARGGPVDREALTWIEARRDDRDHIGCGAVLATATLFAVRGDLPAARAWFDSVEDFHPSVTPRLVRALAREWLAADAASSGRWSEVIAIARRTGPQTAGTRLLGAAAARLRRDPEAPDDAWLWLWWLLAPGHRRMYALLRRALANPTPSPEIVDAVEAVEADDALSVAVGRHASLVRRSSEEADASVDLAGLVAVARAWDRALADPRLEADLRRSALARGARDVDDAIRALPRVVAADLALCAELRGVAIGDAGTGSPTLEDAAWRLRDREIRRYEELCRRLKQSIEQVDRPLEVWSRWCAARSAHPKARALAGEGLAGYLFSEAYGSACNVAVRMHNQGKETILANAIFRWLRERGLEAGADDAVELLTRNAAAGP